MTRAILEAPAVALAQPSLLATQGLAGSRNCVPCHADVASSYARSPMRHALMLPTGVDASFKHAPLEANVDGASYRMGLHLEQATATVRYQGAVAELPIRWVFGAGEAGQTFILGDKGKFLESRVSHYRALNGLDLTIGAANQKAASLSEALGRPMNAADVRECFGCHALGVPRTGPPDLDGIEAGVGCESCHGPALTHVQARRAGKLNEGRLPSLKLIEAEDANQLCGRCHRTWEDVVEMRIRGVLNVRFQPYRLALSKCFVSGDTRLTCVSCHNPHAPVVRGASHYDASCQQCHGKPVSAGSRQQLATCSAGQTSSCTDCHMPKRDLPGAHQSFADHYIQRPSADNHYPDL